MERRGVVSPDSALAADVFDQFCSANTFKAVLGHYRHLCQLLHVQPTHFPHFYPKLKAKLRSWKAQALWNKFDKRASHKCYNRGKTCPNTRVLVIGAGPCGLRSAIEAQLLGAKVVVIEKRDRISRNNVLHLWPFVIHDLRALGAKKFFGRFCAGAIDHISIRQLQCILLKVALIFGVEIHEGVSFEDVLPPEDQDKERIGWRAVIVPSDHPVSQYEFDVLIGADGKRNTLDGFKRKEFRGKLAIAITANFINRHTEAEARVEEISGVAFIFNQKFFKDLYATTGIDLENIVYYKDDTHYFVMTAKKHSLIDKGVILNDFVDTARLLAPENVDKTALMDYAKEAADFSTGSRLPQLEFAVNHYGQPDVAMFDFTSMYAAENASRVVEKNGHRLLVILVGDSLLEPFWPTGSGCARGFLSSLDACWAVRSWSMGNHPLQVLAERESIYRLLAQTTPENLQRDLQSYTLDPHSRYPNLNTQAVLPVQVRGLFITDDQCAVEEFLKAPSLQQELPKKRRRRDSQVHPDTLLHWLQKQVALYDSVRIDDMTLSFKDGLALCAIIHRYRPHLIDFHSLNKSDIASNNQLAFDILERELAIPPVMTGEEMAEGEVPDKLALMSYLSQVYDAFRGEIPHIKLPKLDEIEVLEEENKIQAAKLISRMTTSQKVSLLGKLVTKPSRTSTTRKRHRNFSSDVIEGRKKIIEEIEKNRMDRLMKRKYQRHVATQQFFKSMQMLQSNARAVESTPFEDYSLFVYRQTAPDFKDRVKQLENKLLYPDRDNRFGEEFKKGSGMDDDFSGRVKDLEAKLRGTVQDKKPKDLLRAIGKIEKTDWNVREIEKKIEENRMGKSTSRKAEKVPKWSKEQFEDKFSAMERKLKGRSSDTEKAKRYAEIDSNLQKLEKKIKEGSYVEQGQRGANKVSAMAAHLATIHQEPQIQKPANGRPVTITPQGASEVCHFCNKRVYLMERLSAEGKFFHRGCFRCQYCSTTLRLGNYLFDRDGKYGSRFFCMQHFGMQGVAKRTRTVDDRSKDLIEKAPIQPIDDLDEPFGTPERVEFENLSDCVEVEEDEFTDRNFGASATEASSDTEPSDLSESSSESEDGDAFAEALDTGINAEETLRIAQDWTRKYASERDSDTHCSYGDSDEDDSETATEGEEEIRARELRKQEVPPETLRVGSDTGSETEVASDDEYTSTSSSEESGPEDNSATEISTDSEFEHDGTTHQIPDIVISDPVQVKRGQLEQPKKVQLITASQLFNGNTKKSPKDVKLELKKIDDGKPIIVNNDKLKPAALLNPNRGNYLLNRTQSTEGIASKISLELKKKYLLGTTGFSGNVRKSGSASTLDSKFKSLIDQISEQQKLLNPAPEPSPTMQAFLQGADRLRTSPIVNSMPHLLAKKELPHCDEFKHICGLKDKTQITVENKNGKSHFAKKENVFEIKKADDEEFRPRSPVHETSIVVPQFPRSELKNDIESDSLSSDDSSTSDEESEPECDALVQSPPKLEIHNSRGELMESDDAQPLDSLNLHIPDVCQKEKEYSVTQDKIDLVPSLDTKECNVGKVITVPSSEKFNINSGQILKQVPTPAELFVSNDTDLQPSDLSRSGSPISLKDDSESYKNESVAAGLTETELSDWARDEDTMVSDTLEDLDFNINPQYITFRKHQVPRSKRNVRGVAAKIARTEEFDDDFTHICGKGKTEKVPISNVLQNIENLEFMDTGGSEDDSSSGEKEGVTNKSLLHNSGYVQFINPPEDELPTPVIEAVNCVQLEQFTLSNILKDDEDSKQTECTDTTTSEATTVKDSPVELPKQLNITVDEKASHIIPYDINSKESCNYVQHIQGRVSPFGYVRDSIDVKKCKKSKSPNIQVSNEIPNDNKTTNENQIGEPEESFKTTNNTSPKTTRKLEQLSKERLMQKDLIHEMVLSKVLSQGKSQEKKTRRFLRGTSSPSTTFGSLNSVTDRSLLKNDANKSSLFEEIKSSERPKSIMCVETPKELIEGYNEVRSSSYSSVPQVIQDTPIRRRTPLSGNEEQFYTPLTSLILPTRPRASTVSTSSKIGSKKNGEIQEITPTNAGISLPDIRRAIDFEKDNFKTPVCSELRHNLRESARAKFKMMSNEELGLSPDEKMKKLREKIQRHLLEPNEKCSSPKTGSVENGESKKKSRDPERRKSIIQAVSNFFLKKSPSPPKTPSSQSPTKLFKFRNNKSKEKIGEVSSPPVPPLPEVYTPTQEDSLSDEESKATQSEDVTSTLKKQRTSQRLARQAQNKRLRMAQEMQRQLEELEVKQRELEAQGVALEKALRGENSDYSRDDQRLLSEWFKLTRERNDVMRYENELMIRAQELELEDRHSRLQHQLKNLLANNEKTNEDVALEGRILRELLEIVERRNALGSQLEAERQRYQEEDKDLEAQMLAKGLRLTPLRKLH